MTTRKSQRGSGAHSVRLTRENLVSAGPAVRHIAALLDAGLDVADIAAQADVELELVGRLAWTDPGEHPPQILPEQVEAILGIPLAEDDEPHRWAPAGAAATVLRHGFTLADLERLARTVARTTRSMAADFADRFAEARGAIAEYLYAAEESPLERDLFRAGQDALRDYERYDRSFRGHGYSHANGWGEAASGPRYLAWWDSVCAPTPSPEHRVVERLTVEQIMPTLSPRQREVLAALAAFDDHAEARTALGLTGSNVFATHLANARRRFLALWHEGEVASRPWGTDRRGGAARESLGVLLRRRGNTPRKPASPARRVLPPPAERTHCPQGHPYDEANTSVRPNGNRVCRQCTRDRSRRRRYAAALAGAA